MTQLPQKWHFKALAQKLLWSLPGGIYLNAAASKLRAGHSAEEELLKKHAPNYFRHLAKLREHGFEISGDKSFLEIGAGWDVNVAYLARLTGFGDVTTTDAFRHLQVKQITACIKHFPRLTKQLASEFSLNEETLREKIALAAQVSGENFCEWAGIQYIAPVSRDYSEIASESCDVVYSTAVFEHLYVDDVVNTLKQIRRMLKPAGYSTHVIDLKDHFAYFQKGLAYNNFLKLSDKQWQFWAGNPMSFTNRLLASDWERLFTEAGFEIIYFGETCESSLPRLPNAQLHQQYKDRDERDLTVGELHVITRKSNL